MTRFLLDTHTLVWAATAPQRLGDHARSIIEDPHSDLHVSAASAWELATKHRLGRFPEAGTLVAAFHQVCERLRIHMLDISSDHALRSGGMSWSHRDPFDRMLATQALSDDLILISTDRAFAGLGGLRVLW